jgi:serine/threonine protein phosphatase 1
VNGLPSYIEVNVGGQSFVLIHAGINPELSLYEQDEEICAWIRDYFFMSPGLKGKTILFGHTPTCHLNNRPNCFDVWYDPVYQDKIGIDGGLGPYADGQLNCICLNDMSVTVVKKSDMPVSEGEGITV